MARGEVGRLVSCSASIDAGCDKHFFGVQLQWAIGLFPQGESDSVLLQAQVITLTAGARPHTVVFNERAATRGAVAWNIVHKPVHTLAVCRGVAERYIGIDHDERVQRRLVAVRVQGEGHRRWVFQPPGCNGLAVRHSTMPTIALVGDLELCHRNERAEYIWHHLRVLQMRIWIIVVPWIVLRVCTAGRIDAPDPFVILLSSQSMSDQKDRQPAHCALYSIFTPTHIRLFT
eukprot:scaffold28784_cov112-Isochrysis_galbana.AAC.6